MRQKDDKTKFSYILMNILGHDQNHDYVKIGIALIFFKEKRRGKIN